MENGQIKGGSIFKHKAIHKSTWISPDNRTNNQIDHITINKKWRWSLTDVKAIRGADVGSDHNLVLCKLHLKLKKVDKKASRNLLDSGRLKDTTVRTKFVTELQNRFSALENLQEDDINTQCQKIQNVYIETSQSILGQKRKQNNRKIGSPLTHMEPNWKKGKLSNRN